MPRSNIEILYLGENKTIPTPTLNGMWYKYEYKRVLNNNVTHSTFSNNIDELIRLKQTECQEINNTQ